MNISSLLVHASPEHTAQVQAGLLALSGVEVHAVTDEGRLIVTIEADSDQSVANMFEVINHQPGVLSASMVYHQFESDPEGEA